MKNDPCLFLDISILARAYGNKGFDENNNDSVQNSEQRVGQNSVQFVNEISNISRGVSKSILYSVTHGYSCKLLNVLCMLWGVAVLELDSHPDLNKEPDPRTLIMYTLLICPLQRP